VVAIGHRRANGDWVGKCPFLPGFTDVDGSLDQIMMR
jgi:hypothetical protein